MDADKASTTGNEESTPAEREPPPIIWLPVGVIGLIGVFNLLWAIIVYGFIKQKWGDAFLFALQESAFALILAGAIGSGQKIAFWLTMGYVAFYAYRDWERASQCRAAGHVFTRDVEYLYSAVNAAMLVALAVTLLLPPVIRWFYPKKA